MSTAEPQVQTLSSPDSAIVGESYALSVELFWQGTADQYSSLPPHLDLADWGEVESVRTSTTTVETTQLIRHTFQIRPLKTGSFVIPEIVVPYIESRADTPATETDAEVADYPTVNAGALTIVVIESSDIFLRIMGISAILLLALGIAWGVYRRKTLAIANAPEYRQLTVPVMIHEAQKRRLDGNYYKFYQELLRGAGLLKDSPEKKRLQKQYEELALAVGYKGLVPEEAALDDAMRELERVHSGEQGRLSA